MSRTWTAALALAGALALAAPGFADGNLRVNVRDDDGGRLSLELPGSWVRAFLNVVDPECERAEDVRLYRAIRSLDREGDGGSVRFVGHDGERVHATRVGDVLRMVVFDPDDDSEAEIEMAWGAAECWLLGREPEDRVGLLDLVDDFRVEIVSDDAHVLVAMD